jgi:hypothetical protein
LKVIFPDPSFQVILIEEFTGITGAVYDYYFSKLLAVIFMNNIVFPEKNREKYNHFLDVVQAAYDVANDFSVVAKTAKEKGRKGDVRTIELQVAGL